VATRVPAPRLARTRQEGPFLGSKGLKASAFARLYRGETNFDFINRWKYWFALSGTVIAIGLVALGVRGLNFSIDFKGGTEWQVPTTASVATVKSKLASVNSVLNKATVIQLTSRTTGKQNIQVELPSSVTSNTHLENQVTTALAKIAGVPVDQVTFNAVGPSWGSTITNKAVEAVVVFVVLIFLAIAFYFETKMAIGAIVALLHDMAVTVGIYALSGFQVSPDTVIAFLTVLGYSLYDTIVVFDKVKENTKGLASTNRVTYTDVVNLSMNQVLARSINTSFVAIMPVFCILVIGSWILGASALNDFGLALFIGLLSGAYSSIFIASPVLALLKEREPRYVEIRRRLAAYPQARQILTAANVSGGALIGTGASAGAGARAGAKGLALGTGAQASRTSGRNGPGLAPDEDLAGERGPGSKSRAGAGAPGAGGGYRGAGLASAAGISGHAEVNGVVGGSGRAEVNGAAGGANGRAAGNGGSGASGPVAAAGLAGEMRLEQGELPASADLSRGRAGGTGAGAVEGDDAGTGPAQTGDASGVPSAGARPAGPGAQDAASPSGSPVRGQGQARRPAPPRPRPKKKSPRRR